MEKDPEEDEELDERMGSTRGQWHYRSNRRGEDEILTGSRPWWAGLEERLPLDVDSLSSGERRWLDHLYAAATCALYSCPSSAAGSVSPSSPLFSPSLPASADSSSPAAALELAPRLCQALLHALRQLRSETCDVEEQEPFWCAMNLPPISLADLLRASRASVSDGDHRMATTTSTTMTTTTSTARTSRRLITAPPAGFVGCDLGAFFRSEVEPSPASRSSPPPDLFALPRDSVQMTASSPIRQVPFILMARLKSGNASVRRETDLRKGVGLYLEDRSGCLACEMLEPDPSAVGQIILISSANFIPTHTPPSSPDELPGYLEISQWVPLLDPSNPQASPASIQALGERYKPLVPRHVALRAGLTKELFDHESGEPSAKRKKKEQVSIVGKVTALSPVKWTHDKPQFLLQLNLTYKRKSIAGATREVSVLVLFGERECARWYPCLVMDKNYLITRLRPAKLFEQSEVFAATAATSLHLFEGSVAPSQVLNQSRETSLLLFDHPTPWDSSVPSSPASPSPSQSPSRSPSPSPNPSSAAAAVSGLSLVDLVHRRLVNYEGRITGYLGHGVFELDDRLDRKLFLSHYHTPHLDRVLRIGNLVRLYNVHLIVRPWHPVPYSSDDFSGLVEGFGCCSYSRVSVVQFGSDCQPPPPLFSARKRGSLETYLRRYPLSAAPWILHVYPSLVQRWHSDRRILFAGEDLGLLHTLCRVARLQQTNIHLWNEFTNHRACCITRPILGLPEVPTLKEFLVAAATLKRPPGTSLHAPFVVCSSELPRPVVLVGKLTGATELSDDTGRVSVEIIGLDAGMLDAYVCLPAFRLAFDPAAGLCVVAAIRDVVVHSPLAALEQQQAIPPAQEIKKEAAHGFVVMVLDRLVHKPNTGLSLQSLCVEAVHLPTTTTSAALGGEGLRPPVITLELPAPRLTRYYAALRPGGVYGLNGVSAVDGSRGERHRLHPAGRIESVQLVSADNGRPLLCCSEDQLPAAPSIVASRRAVTLHDAALAEALPRLLNPANDLQTVHELLEVEYKQTGGPYGAVQPALRDERAVVSFACIVVSVLQATPESLAQRRVVCADHLHAPPADTITVSADCYVMPRSLLPGARAVFRNVQRQVSPGFEVRCQLQATSSVRVLSLPTSSAVLNAAALPIERAYDHVADACLYDLQCRPCLRLSLLRLRCTVTAFILVTFSLGPGRELRAEAEASIDDGTGEAKLLLSGPLAAELLGLSIEDTEVLKRGLQRHGIFKHGQAEEGGRNAGRWRAVSPPLHVLQRPLLPPSEDAGVAGPNLASAPPLTPAHELLLKEKMRLVTRPSQRFLITCGVKLPSRQQHNERGRWHDPRRQKPVDAKDAGGKGLKQHTHAPPRLWLEANSVVRASPSQLVM